MVVENGVLTDAVAFLLSPSVDLKESAARLIRNVTSVAGYRQIAKCAPQHVEALAAAKNEAAEEAAALALSGCMRAIGML